MKKTIFLVLAAIFLSAPLFSAEKKMNVVATTTFNADLVRKIGGEFVEVKSVAPPKFDVHFIQPRPSDVRNLSKADLYVHSGLDLEAWSDPLTEAAGKPQFFRGADRSLDLSEGIQLLKPPTGPLSRAQGDIHLFGNPHYHLSPENALIMSRGVAQKLKQIDPQNASAYEANQAAFASELERRIQEWKTKVAALSGREVFTYHDEIEYIAHFTGLVSDKYLEPKPGIPPTPKHLAELEAYGKTHAIKAILQTTYCPRPASDSLARKIGAKVFPLAHNVNEVPEASDIFSLYDYDISQILEALK